MKNFFEQLVRANFRFGRMRSKTRQEHIWAWKHIKE